MKPESIKSILRSYLKERQHSSYDDAASYLHEPSEYIPVAHVQSCNTYDDIAHAQRVYTDQSDLLVQVPQFVDLPLNELNAPLEHHLEALARGVGHQLNQMVHQFDANRLGAINSQASANGNRIIQFKERIIRVPPTCDRVQIPIIQTRAADSVVNATWRTCDKSAKAGFHYVYSQGSISFAQDEEEKTIEVEIIRDQENESDIHFAVELFDAEGTYNALMIYIVDDSRLYPEEKLCIQTLQSKYANVSEIVTRLRGNVTPNTFKAALLCLGSCADSMPTKELFLGAELLRLTIPHASLITLTNVFCEFFNYLPELEDIVSMF